MLSFASDLTLQVYETQRLDRTLRSGAAQRAVFNFSARELQLALVRQWHLPELLISMMDERQIQNPRVRTVQLATSLARHTAQGWDNAAIPDDLAAIEALLHIGRESLLHRLSVPHEAMEALLQAGGRRLDRLRRLVAPERHVRLRAAPPQAARQDRDRLHLAQCHAEPTDSCSR